jgi:hypothetical protein
VAESGALDRSADPAGPRSSILIEDIDVSTPGREVDLVGTAARRQTETGICDRFDGRDPRHRHEHFAIRHGQSARETEAFASAYYALSGYKVDASYLRDAKVFLALRGGRLVGGFVLNTVAPFRTMARLPVADQRRLAHEFQEGDTVEMTCIWLVPEERRSPAATRLWLSFVWNSSRAHRTNVVFGTEVGRLRRFYETTRPRLLYQGHVYIDGQVRKGWVYTIPASRWPMALLSVLRRRS